MYWYIYQQRHNDSHFLKNGQASITGQVLENNTPVSRRVLLYERCSGQLIAQTYSDTNGHYRFDNINEQATFFVVSLDEYKDGIDYNLVGQDLIKGVV